MGLRDGASGKHHESYVDIKILNAATPGLYPLGEQCG